MTWVRHDCPSPSRVSLESRRQVPILAVPDGSPHPGERQPSPGGSLRMTARETVNSTVTSSDIFSRATRCRFAGFSPEDRQRIRVAGQIAGTVTGALAGVTAISVGLLKWQAADVRRVIP